MSVQSTLYMKMLLQSKKNTFHAWNREPMQEIILYEIALQTYIPTLILKLWAEKRTIMQDTTIYSLFCKYCASKLNCI